MRMLLQFFPFAWKTIPKLKYKLRFQSTAYFSLIFEPAFDNLNQFLLVV